MQGTILKDGTVIGEDNKVYHLPFRGTDEEGYPEVLMDASSVGGSGYAQRQSIKPYIGMTVSFVGVGNGYNYEIIN